jgi:arsenate reductase
MRNEKPDHPFNVLFLCTGNSARSILAEAILNRIGAGKFVAHSAGSQPKGAVHPQALALLQRLGFPTAGLRSKSWDEFAVAGAPHLDFVFTVCDNAANEVCPVWPGQPMTAHWGVPDPAAAEGTESQIAQAFRDAFLALQRRIELFANLPVRSLGRMALKKHLDEIGRTASETAKT